MEKDILNNYKKAGEILVETLDYGEKLIKEEESVKNILDKIEEFIAQKNVLCAFPPQISVNSCAAHYCPTDTDDIILKEGDVVKLDCGICVDGYIADSARTIDLGDNKELINASKDALGEAMKLMRPEVSLSEIGATIQEAIQSYGFSPIKNLSGHGLDRWQVHAVPQIPNIDTGDESVLEEDLVLAVEPFATDGSGIVYESGTASIFSLVGQRPIRSNFTREALTEIKKYNGLPFTTRWLTKKLGEGKTRFALRELTNLEMLEQHPPLVDRNKGLVSQAEHSVIVADKPIILTKKYG